MKRKLISIISLIAMVTLLCGCQIIEPAKKQAPVAKKVTLNVTTTWSGRNIASQNYQKFVSAFSKSTGIDIVDSSETADEAFKQRIIADFQVGDEPDAMYFFTGNDADALIKAGKVVSVNEIREIYPDFANNIEDEAFQVSDHDGKIYSVPTYGYWEAMYVNFDVCKAAGVEVPDENTTWDEFMDICEKIKKAGYIPISASIASEPHYLFEYFIYNNSANGSQGELPKEVGDDAYKAWEAGLTQFRDVYQAGYFSPDALFCDDATCFNRFLNNEAAFCISGSWMIPTILAEKSSKATNYGVTFVPGTDARKNTEMIGGFSSGWYISKKAWDDPGKRDAAVKFVEYMTKNSIIESFATITLGATSLKGKAQYIDTTYSTIQKSAASMLEKKTGLVPAVQDKVDATVRSPLMDSIQDIVSGKTPVKRVLDRFIESEKRIN
ncbi:MAG: extracellular solute-binding protein [Lachnospiraceae bacterium]|jgi:raffinose/stachyose/melibiose transport system substrate-binding protein|nr:extracellular solute-binding protein [Lachnospiraceae bacterium]